MQQGAANQGIGGPADHAAQQQYFSAFDAACKKLQHLPLRNGGKGAAYGQQHAEDDGGVQALFEQPRRQQ